MTRNGRVPSRASAFLALVLALSCASCGQATKPTALVEAEEESPLTPDADDPAVLELYSSLAGKMARMEELLNGIDRFLGDPDFQGRLVEDGAEFHRLLAECRGLYPRDLDDQDRLLFDQAIDATLLTAGRLNEALQSRDHAAARSALSKLDHQRRHAHARFSY